ncbi:MAG: radical SAM protein [Deltaproteobacteria bacterium]|nr:radical SAM protein [Deltaproteobacteria bacterium]
MGHVRASPCQRPRDGGQYDRVLRGGEGTSLLNGCSGALLRRHGGLADGEHELQRRCFAEKRLYALQVESTDACPQDCVFCYAGAGPVETRGLTTAEIEAVLQDAAVLGIHAIDWLGGDPLARPDWYELMCRARELGLINNVWTSGLPLRDPAVAARVHEVAGSGFVSVHADSIERRTLARLRRGGDTGQLDAILAGVDNLLGLGRSPDRMLNCITFTAAQDPQDTIDTMRWWLERKGIRTCLTMFNPSGCGAELASLAPHPDAVRAVCRERDRLSFGEDGGSIGAMDTDKFYCGTMATVTFTGDVTPCSVIRAGVGNIRNRPLREIVACHLDALVHARLHEPGELPAPCGGCRHNDHCWGCRASAYHRYGDADGRDPLCPFARAGDPARLEGTATP